MLTKKNEDMAEDVARLKTMLQKQTNNLIAANREKEALKKSKEILLNDSKILKLEAEERSRDLYSNRIEIEDLKEFKKNLLQELQKFKTNGERPFASADVRINRNNGIPRQVNNFYISGRLPSNTHGICSSYGEFE